MADLGNFTYRKVLDLIVNYEKFTIRSGLHKPVASEYLLEFNAINKSN